MVNEKRRKFLKLLGLLTVVYLSFKIFGNKNEEEEKNRLVIKNGEIIVE